MKADFILIFYVYNPSESGEVKNGAAALHHRCVQQKRAKYVYRYKVPYACKDPGDVEMEAKDELIETTHGKGGVGVYVLAHHGVTIPDFDGIPPEMMATIVVSQCQALEVGAIRKVALLACRAAHMVSKSSAKRAPTNIARQNFERSLLVRFCEALQKLGEEPMIAGWDDFVSVCFPGNAATTAAFQQKDLLGRKTTVNKSGADGAQKKVVHWSTTKGGVEVLQLSDWTDKV